VALTAFIAGVFLVLAGAPPRGAPHEAMPGSASRTRWYRVRAALGVSAGDGMDWYSRSLWRLPPGRRPPRQPSPATSLSARGPGRRAPPPGVLCVRWDAHQIQLVGGATQWLLCGSSLCGVCRQFGGTVRRACRGLSWHSSSAWGS
jgi:hypothetical protein